MFREVLYFTGADLASTWRQQPKEAHENPGDTPVIPMFTPQLQAAA